MSTVVQTDHAWPDVEIERAVIERAGHRLVAGPAAAGAPAEIEDLVAAHDPSAIMTCWAEVSAAAIATPSELRIVQRLGVGLDNIAVDAATARGAWVANVPDYCVEEVSDHAVALIMGWLRGVVSLDRAVKAGRWDPSAAKLRRAATMTAGILGLGKAEMKAVVVGGEIVARYTLPLNLSFDHRATDGADAARFVGEIKSYLEVPGRLLLED